MKKIITVEPQYNDNLGTRFGTLKSLELWTTHIYNYIHGHIYNKLFGV